MVGLLLVNVACLNRQSIGTLFEWGPLLIFLRSSSDKILDFHFQGWNTSQVNTQAPVRLGTTVKKAFFP